MRRTAGRGSIYRLSDGAWVAQVSIGGRSERKYHRDYRTTEAEAREALADLVRLVPPRPTPSQRFWALVDKSGTCWEWTGRRAHGYGLFWDGARTVPAHRFSYREANGDIPASLYVCHRCDNPGCVRPEHLFAGTQTDNMADMVAKGRQARKAIALP